MQNLPVFDSVTKDDDDRHLKVMTPSPFPSQVNIHKQPDMNTLNERVLNSSELLSKQDVKDLRNLILPSTNEKSPFYQYLPVANSKPVDKVIKRFQAWIKVLNSLISYFQVLSVSSKEISKIHLNLCQSINFPFFTNGSSKGFNYQEKLKTPTEISDLLSENYKMQDLNKFPIINQPVTKDDKHVQSFFEPFGSNSIQDVPNILLNHHKNLSLNYLNLSNNLIRMTIPRLESIKKDLGSKIKEIKNLNLDFKDKEQLSREIALTGQKLYEYLESLTKLSDPNFNHKKDKDPFIIKRDLDLQLKAQVLQESDLREAFINLQSSSSLLEKIIIDEIQKALNSYVEIIDSNVKCSYELIINDLKKDGFLSKNFFEEWNNFVTKDNNQNLLSNIKPNAPIPHSRKLSHIQYPFRDSIMGKCIKFGVLAKKSKFLKNYKQFYFILTANSLLEFPKHDGKLDKSFGNKDIQMKLKKMVADTKNKSGTESDDCDDDDDDPAVPLFSYNLSYCTISALDKLKHKFTLHYKHPKSSEESIQKISFKSKDESDLNSWYNLLKILIRFEDPYERAAEIEKILERKHFNTAKTEIPSSIITSDFEDYSAREFSSRNSTLTSSLSTPTVSD